MIAILLLLSLCGQLWAQDAVVAEDTRLLNDVLKSLSEADRLVRPARNTTVQLGLTLSAVVDLDEDAGTLTAVYFIQVSWVDPRLRWGSTAPNARETSTSLRIPISGIWKPDLKLWDNLESSENIDPEVFPIVFKDGTVLWIPPMKLTTRCETDDEDDDDEKVKWICTLKFGLWTHNGWEVALQSHGNATSVNVEYLHKTKKAEKWEVTSPEKDGAVIETSYFSCCTEPYPHADFKMVLTRDATSGGSLVVASSLLIVLAMFL